MFRIGTLQRGRGFIETLTICNDENSNSGRSGRRSTVRSNENIDRVQEELQNYAQGISCLRNGLGRSKSSFQRFEKNT